MENQESPSCVALPCLQGTARYAAWVQRIVPFSWIASLILSLSLAWGCETRKDTLVSQQHALWISAAEDRHCFEYELPLSSGAHVFTFHFGSCCLPPDLSHIWLKVLLNPVKERKRKSGRIVEVKRKHLGGKRETVYIWGEGTQAVPARPSDKDESEDVRMVGGKSLRQTVEFGSMNHYWMLK
jgi:hypothetical protein